MIPPINVVTLLEPIGWLQQKELTCGPALDPFFQWTVAIYGAQVDWNESGHGFSSHDSSSQKTSRHTIGPLRNHTGSRNMKHTYLDAIFCCQRSELDD